MHKNNFDFLRLIFALLVMVTHSYALTGHGNNDFFFIFTDRQIQLSYLGVRGFFVISGYLIFQSLLRSTDLLDYFWKRLLRLFPALLVMLGLTLLLGWIVYDGSDGSYWAKRDVWTYFPRNASLLLLQSTIKGVFATNPEHKAINGALWTICYEFTFYVALGALFWVRKWPRVALGILVAGWLVIMVCNQFFFDELLELYFFMNGARVVELGAYFAGGSLLAALRFEKFKHAGLLAALALGVIIGATGAGYFMTAFRFVCLPIAIIGLGNMATPGLRDIGQKVGDLSYGIYIYGFIVQQTLVHYFGMDYFVLMITSIPITMVLGYASWHLIEKRALMLKKIRPTAWIARLLRKGG
jgi:peptidoglycan/LPS O-acetylase OafA/YrhL